jgi:DNA-binding MarR family transcriptional regulator
VPSEAALMEQFGVSRMTVNRALRELAAEGLVERRAQDSDRRVQVVRLTAKGRRTFDAMATVHERWVVDLFEGLDAGERERLHALLGRLKHVVAARIAAGDGGARA